MTTTTNQNVDPNMPSLKPTTTVTTDALTYTAQLYTTSTLNPTEWWTTPMPTKEFFGSGSTELYTTQSSTLETTVTTTITREKTTTTTTTTSKTTSTTTTTTTSTTTHKTTSTTNRSIRTTCKTRTSTSPLPSTKPTATMTTTSTTASTESKPMPKTYSSQSKEESMTDGDDQYSMSDDSSSSWTFSDFNESDSVDYGDFDSSDNLRTDIGKKRKKRNVAMVDNFIFSGENQQESAITFVQTDAPDTRFFSTDIVLREGNGLTIFNLHYTVVTTVYL